MKFLAYANLGDSVRISYESRDESAGILGTVTAVHPPVGEAETREEITQIAYAYLGQDPTVLVYITDSQNRLLEIVLNRKYHDLISARATWLCMAWVLLFLCVACFLATILAELHWLGLGIFVAIAASYVASVRLRIQNEIESAVVCTIILLLILLSIPAIRRAGERSQQLPPAQHSPPPTR